MKEPREKVLLEFILERPGEARSTHQLSSGTALPRLGDWVSVWENRDDQGNYLPEARQTMSGVAFKVEHVYLQTGKDSASWRLTHYITVYLGPDTGGGG